MRCGQPTGLRPRHISLFASDIGVPAELRLLIFRGIGISEFGHAAVAACIQCRATSKISRHRQRVALYFPRDSCGTPHRGNISRDVC
jgi:hypothetical protein